MQTVGQRKFQKLFWTLAFVVDNICNHGPRPTPRLLRYTFISNTAYLKYSVS